MTKSLWKNTFREIKNSKARFISIMAIIALGVGFFAGIKATAPSMYNMAETYYTDHNLMDYRLVSTVGFDDDDVNAVSGVDGVTDVMPSYFCDVQMPAESGGKVVRLISVPTEYNNNGKLNTLELATGRLPQKSGEIVIEGTAFNDKYNIGDTVTFDKLAGDVDITANIKHLDYTVVGTVESPLYISYQRGTSNVGSGNISQYMYVCAEDFSFERYTELYVKTDVSQNYSAFSNDYKSKIATMCTSLENTADARCEAFNTDVIGKADSELADAKTEYCTQKSDTEKQLADAQSEIDTAKQEYNDKIAEAQQQLDDAQSQINSAETQLNSAQQTYSTQISSAQSTLNSKKANLESAKNDYETAQQNFNAQISQAKAKLDEGWAQYNAAYSAFKTTQEPQLLAGIAQAQSSADQLNTQISSTTDEQTLQYLKAQLEQVQAVVYTLNQQYSGARAKLENSKKQLDTSQAEYDTQKQQGQAKLDDALAQIQSGQAQLDSGEKELGTQKSNGLAKLQSAQSEIDSAKSKYNSGTAELAQQKGDGQSKLDSAQTELDSKRAEADEKFAEAQQKIDDAQSKLDDLSTPQWYVFNRDDNPGYSTFSQNADRLDAVASVFPLFFLLVAVLVCVTTMTRLIEEKRTEIGTLKALGYSNTSIVMKFVTYALIAGVIGSIIGTAIGVFTLPFIIYNAYKIMYYMTDITLVPNVPSIVLGIAAAVFCTAVVSVVVCLKSLHSKPAAIMRPKAPKPGKRIMLEHLNPLWKRMSFTGKLTARNLFRYKSRMCMTVLGVAGCTALIVAAFGLLNSFDPLTNDQFTTIYKYNTIVVPKDGGSETDLKYLTEKIGADSNVSSYMLGMEEEVTVTCGSKIKDNDTTLVVAQNPDELKDLISLHTRQDKTELTIDDNGVMLNEKLASELGVKEGGTVQLLSDSGTAEVTVSGIYEHYLHNFVYMSPTLYNKLYSKNLTYNMVNVKLSDVSDSAQNDFGTQYLADNRIAAVTFVGSSIDDFKNMLNSLNMVVLVMIICAAALAFVVLYNLTNINIAERVREIATFKVLGFRNNETSSFIYRENIILTLLGIIAGLVLGVFLTGFIVQTVEVDNIMFGRTIYFTSFLYAAGLTMVFSLLVNAAMSFKIKAVNMVESLKSIE